MSPTKIGLVKSCFVTSVQMFDAKYLLWGCTKLWVYLKIKNTVAA